MKNEANLMTKYYTSFIRVFKPGLGTAKEVIEEFESLELDAPGVVTGTPFAPTEGGITFVLSRVFNDASGIDKYNQAIMGASEARQQLVNRLSEKCINTTMRISREISPPTYRGAKPPTCLVRNFIKVKRGHLDEAIDLLTSNFSEIPEDRTKPLLTENTTGRSNLLVITTPYENFETAEEGWLRVRGMSGTSRGRRLAEITQESMRIPTLVLHRTLQN